MRYVFRADASLIIGSGHVMRSSAIAEELISRGEETIFVGSITDIDWVAERIKGLGFSRIFNKPNLFSSDKETDVLILDSYTIEINDFFINPSNWRAIITIVDFMTPEYDCHLRIHPGMDSSWHEDKSFDLLSGPEFIPIRKSLSARNNLNKNTSGPLRIVITSGGTDAFSLVSALASVISEIDIDFYAYLFTNKELPINLDRRFEVVPIGPRLDATIEIADLVLTTASTSSLEFIAKGLPIGIVCVVDNQENNYRKLGELGVAAQIGRKDSNASWALNRILIKELISSHELRNKLSTSAEGLIDNNGARRITDAILGI